MGRLLRIALPIALSCFVGCGGRTPHAAAPNERSDVDVDEGPSDARESSDAARDRFDAERIDVVDSDYGPSSYAFSNRSGEITQEDFVQRYHDLTGRTDLDEVTHKGPGTPLIVLGAVAIIAGVIGDAVLLAAALQPQQTCRPTPLSGGQVCFDQGSSNLAPAVLGVIGFSTLTVGGSALVISGSHSNRRSRELSRHDAERFAEQYNDDLLRNAGRTPRHPPHSDR
jgi:hypothetical protein